MGKNNHILDFNSKTSSADGKSALKPLPQLVEGARNVCIEDIEANLKTMFEQADDCLFDMSESGYNNTHFDAMRLLRLKKEGLVRQFKQEIQICFSDNLGKSRGLSDEANDFDSMSFENIALVNDSDLEEGIAIDSIVKKAQTANSDQLEKIRTRLDTLIATQTITKENNPFEPAFICVAFKNASVALDIDIESLLVIYKLFERMVINELEHTYQKVNEFFIEKGVLPELKVVYKSKQKRQSYKASHSAENDLDNDLLGIATTDSPPVTNAPLSQDASEQIVSMMQSLLAQNRSPVAQTQVVPVMETPQLVHALTGIQSTNESNFEGTKNIVADLKNLIVSQQNAPQEVLQPGGLGQFNEDMIDIVSMLFDFILDDKNVHVEIKSVIARLQIPMLKVGLVDKSFFSDKKHAARILLNDIGRAGVSWDPKDKDAQLMLKKIEVICDEINANFDDDVSIFSELLEDFNSFQKQFQRRSDIFEKRIKESEEGKAKAENAREFVNNELEKICVGKQVPDSLKAILKNVWVNIMFLERLKDSEDGWLKVCKIAQLFVWSVQPISSAEGVEKLTSRIPNIVKNLKKGFEIISVSPIDATHMLEKLEETHRTIIEEAKDAIESGKSEEILRLSAAPLVPNVMPSSVEFEPDTPEQVVENSEKSEKKQPKVEKIEIHDIGFTQEQIGKPANQEELSNVELKPQSLKAVERLSAGHWVELEIDGANSRCKLAAKISSSNKFIFVNRSGIKVAEYFVEGLASEYQMGRLKILDEEALFDRALESVISNLRTMKA